MKNTPNIKPGKEEISSFSDKLNPKELELKEFEKQDLAILSKVQTLIEEILKEISNNRIMLKNLVQIGELLDKISWQENNPDCIRNKHGYRSRYKEQGNKKNLYGAKIDFEMLGYLQKIKQYSEGPEAYTYINFLYYEGLSQTRSSLEVLQKKIRFILSDESKASSLMDRERDKLSDDNDLGYLKKLLAYLNDRECISKLIDLVLKNDEEMLTNLNFNGLESRYELGFFFVKLGEISKKISEYLKPDESTGFLLNTLFTKLGHYRQLIKSNPCIIYKDHKSLAEIIASFLNIKPDLSNLLNEIIKLLRDKITNIEGVNNYHTISIQLLSDQKNLVSINSFFNKFSLAKQSQPAPYALLDKKLKLQNEILQLNSKLQDLESKKQDFESKLKEEPYAFDLNDNSSIRKKPSKLKNNPIKQFKSVLKKYLTKSPEKKTLKAVDLETNIQLEIDELNSHSRNQVLSKELNKKLGELKTLLELSKHIKLTEGMKLSNLENSELKLRDHNEELQAKAYYQDLSEKIKKFERERKRKISEYNNNESEILLEAINNLKSIGEEIGNLKVLNNSVGEFKYSYALKLSLGFLGDFFKYFLRLHDNKALGILHQNSPLNKVILGIVQIRDAVMHLKSKLKRPLLEQAIIENILVWEQDFKEIANMLAAQLDHESFLAFLPSSVQEKIKAANYSKEELEATKKTQTIHSLNRLLMFKEASNEYETSKTILDQSFIRPSIVIERNLNIVKINPALGGLSSIKDNEAILKESLQLARQHSFDPEVQAYIPSIKNELALIYLFQGKFKEAVNELRELVSILREDNEDLKLRIAFVEAMENDPASIIDLIKDYSSISLKKESFDFTLFNAICFFADYNVGLNNFYTAKECILAAELLYTIDINFFKTKYGQAYSSGEAMIYELKGHLRYREGITTNNKGYLKESLDFYNKCLEISNILAPNSSIQKGYNNKIARTFLALNDVENALIHFQKAGILNVNMRNNYNKNVALNDIKDVIKKLVETVFNKAIVRSAAESERTNYILKDHFANIFSKLRIDVLNLMKELELKFNNLADININEEHYDEAFQSYRKAVLSSQLNSFTSSLFIKRDAYTKASMKLQNFLGLIKENLEGSTEAENLQNEIKYTSSLVSQEEALIYNRAQIFSINSSKEGTKKLLANTYKIFASKLKSYITSVEQNSSSDIALVLKIFNSLVSKINVFSKTHNAIMILRNIAKTMASEGEENFIECMEELFSFENNILKVASIIIAQSYNMPKFLEPEEKLGTYFASKIIILAQMGLLSETSSKAILSICNCLKNSLLEDDIMTNKFSIQVIGKIFLLNVSAKNIFDINAEFLLKMHKFVKVKLYNPLPGMDILIDEDKIKDQDLEQFNNQILETRIKVTNKSGNNFFANKNYSQAVIKFTEALALVKKFNNASDMQSVFMEVILSNRAKAYQLNGNIELALDDYTSIMSINPNNTKAEEFMKVFRHNNMEHSEAKSYFKNAVIQEDSKVTKLQTNPSVGKSEIVQGEQSNNNDFADANSMQLNHDISLTGINSAFEYTYFTTWEKG
ncbi:MAG: hypothetical protein K0Q51_1389 [Rickettsiaceae bacterium]|jgi:tetratricopeptide (TPR) repeat protein|nr:hypothetical protein [Rickettsiaceae bacterium]